VFGILWTVPNNSSTNDGDIPSITTAAKAKLAVRYKPSRPLSELSWKTVYEYFRAFHSEVRGQKSWRTEVKEEVKQLEQQYNELHKDDDDDHDDVESQEEEDSDANDNDRSHHHHTLLGNGNQPLEEGENDNANEEHVGHSPSRKRKSGILSPPSRSGKRPNKAPEVEFDPNAPVAMDELTDLQKAAIDCAGVEVSTLTAGSVKEMSTLLAESALLSFADQYKYLHYCQLDETEKNEHEQEHGGDNNGTTPTSMTRHVWCVVPRDYTFFLQTSREMLQDWLCPHVDRRIGPIRFTTPRQFKYCKTGRERRRKRAPPSKVVTKSQEQRNSHEVTWYALKHYMALFERELRQQGLWKEDYPYPSRDEVSLWYDAICGNVYAPCEDYVDVKRRNPDTTTYSDLKWTTVSMYLCSHFKNIGKTSWKKDLQAYLSQFRVAPMIEF
jgi:hypothetical protein